MEKYLVNENGHVPSEEIVIPDECGDTMWDAVLQQEAKAGEIKTVSTNAAVLLNRINTVQVCDATGVK